MRSKPVIGPEYQPTSTDALDGVLCHLRKAGECSILDPCAGSGATMVYLSHMLDVDPSHAYAVELDPKRAQAIIKAKVINGAYAETAISPNSFGLVFLNPPRHGELGGGLNDEAKYVILAHRQLVPHGILACCIPIHLLRNIAFMQSMDARFDNIRVYRTYGGTTDVIVIATKRESMLLASGTGELASQGWMTGNMPMAEDLTWCGDPAVFFNRFGRMVSREAKVAVYEIPESHPPRTFRKSGYSRIEMHRLASESPLNTVMEQAQEPVMARPPLPLERGHTGMLLASGQINGVVHSGAPSWDSHVVRGTSRKEKRSKGVVKSTVNEKKRTMVDTSEVEEYVVMVIRAVDERGTIVTFSDEKRDDLEESQEDEDPDDA